MANVDAPVKWLLIATMQSLITFERLEAFQWLIFRGEGAPGRRAPVECWGPLHAGARAKSIPVYHEWGLYESWHFQEFPGTKRRHRE